MFSFCGCRYGPVHIAALNVPVVSISPTKFVKSLRWGPWDTKSFVISNSSVWIWFAIIELVETLCLDAVSPTSVSKRVQDLILDRYDFSHGTKAFHDILRMQWVKQSFKFCIIVTNKDIDYYLDYLMN